MGVLKILLHDLTIGQLLEAYEIVKKESFATENKAGYQTKRLSVLNILSILLIDKILELSE